MPSSNRDGGEAPSGQAVVHVSARGDAGRLDDSAVGVTSEQEYFRMVNDYEHAAGGNDRSADFTLTSDRRTVVECGGVYKRLQSEIRSPAFPSDYQANLHCEYTFKSPFVCSSQYHFQFLEFALEPSRNCSKDRVAIGEDEILCGTVIGSKLYEAPGGLLRMKFVSDSWGSGRGFRILVTRQPCTDDNEAAESSTAYSVFTTIQVADETEMDGEDTTTAPSVIGDGKIVSSRQDIPPEFNPGGNGYLPPTIPPTVAPSYPVPTYPPQQVPCPAPCAYLPPWGCSASNYPYIPVLPPRLPGCDPRVQSCPPSYPTYPSYPQPQNPSYLCPTAPCGPGQNVPQYPQYPPQYPPYQPGYPTTDTEGTTSLGGPPPGYQPVKTEPKPEFPEPTTERVDPENQVAFVPGLGPACCRNAFNQRRFYLASANFPSETTVNQDCVVQIQRASPYICRLVIGFKFFLHGNDQLPGCPGGFVEIDGQRICGCRTGQVYRTADFGPYATKTLRIHSQGGRFPTVRGFLLDIYQEECPQRYPLKRSDGSDRERFVQQPQQQVPGNRRYSYEMTRVEGRQLAVPVRTIETTNSTQRITHQFYFFNPDEAKPVVRPQEVPFVAGESQHSEKFVEPSALLPGGANRCLFTTLDWLRLKLDWLWIFKPICWA
uniref:CUB domain-containing protein n=1 Tax=Anopheles farauti TaxID=69004 RepID=A0A182QSX1_9DIPT